MSNQPQRLYAATRKGLFTFERGASGWAITRSAFLGDNCTAVHVDPRDGTVYAAIGHGHFGAHLHRSDDGGETWPEIAAPAYPQTDEAPIVDMLGRTIPQSLEMIWVLQSGPAVRPGEIWCGTIPGGLFRSPDRGMTWQLNAPLWDDPLRRQWMGGGSEYPGIHSIHIDPRDPDRLTLAVSCGGVWRSTDAGASWQCHGKGMKADYLPPEIANADAVQDPHRTMPCTTAPDRVWMQHHNGIFRSDDGGQVWTEITAPAPSRFGFAVAVHPEDADTAWFVPAIKDEHRIPVDGRLVVTRTRDGGESFDVFGDGLPDTHCYDLVYRHALEVDASGEGLAMGSTTGSLWTSASGGERWTLLNAHLPPIHAVTFDPRI